MYDGNGERITVYKNGDSLEFKHENNYESRGTSIEALVRECLDKYRITKDFVLQIETGDIPNPAKYNFCVTDKNYLNAFPCFFYDSWPQIGVDDYSHLINSFIRCINKLLKF